MSSAKSKQKNIRDRIIFTTIVLFTILIICSSILYYITSVYKHDLLTTTSPDGLYTLKFQQVGDPAWPFGATTAKVTVKGVKNTKKENFEKSFTADIDNDGVSLSSDSCKVTWTKKYVQIDISGSRQLADSYVIEFASDHNSKSNNYLKPYNLIP